MINAQELRMEIEAEEGMSGIYRRRVEEKRKTERRLFAAALVHGLSFIWCLADNTVHGYLAVVIAFAVVALMVGFLSVRAQRKRIEFEWLMHDL